MRNHLLSVLTAAAALGSNGCGMIWACKQPEVTAVSLNPCDGKHCHKESGIPFYLPKPLLVVSKNFRNIETPTVGLTDSAPIPGGYDDQSKYADLNARTNFVGLNPAPTGGASSGGNQGGAVAGDGPTPPAGSAGAYKSAPILHSSGAPISPGKAPSDGLAPETFYTYQIIFVPDMSQKYGLKIKGGPGEIRAAMNLVNGWQFTGIGPYYMKDSSTSQNILSQGISTRLGGQAAADVIHASADLAKVLPGGRNQGGTLSSDDPRVQKLSETISALPLNLTPMTMVNFAEIHVYEPHLTPDGRMDWCEIVHLQFNRDYLGAKTVCLESTPAPKTAVTPGGTTPTGGGNQGGVIVGSTDDAVARTAVAGVFGIPSNSPALSTVPGGGLQGGSLQGGATGVPGGGVNQIQVDCGDKGGCRPSREFNLFKCFFGPKAAPRPTISTRTVTQGTIAVPGLVNTALPSVPANLGGATPGGANQGGTIPGTGTATPAIINQPIFNQPYSPQPPLPSVPTIPLSKPPQE